MYTKKVSQFSCWNGLPEKKMDMTKESADFIKKMVLDELYKDETSLVNSTSVYDVADALVDAYYYLEDCAAKHGYETKIGKEGMGALGMVANINTLYQTDNLKEAAKIIEVFSSQIEEGPAEKAEQAISATITAIRQVSIELGINIDIIFRIVHKANMAKIDPSTMKPYLVREDGKVLKPDGWKDPKDEIIAYFESLSGEK